jgi:SNF2 family DNA or RNA helicase
VKLLLKKWIKKDRKKVLLFSSFTRTLDILSKVLDGLGYSHCRLDGSTPKEARLKLCDEFNNDSTLSVFLISTKAGGVGLNLTGAQIVVIFDPSWNP